MKQKQSKKINKFRVPVNMPELWKVQSIAAYLKEKQLKKNAQKLLKQNQNEKSSNSNSINERLVVDEDKKKKEIRQELEMLQKEGNTIRQKIQTFNNVRNSLVWLLSKAKACEKACTCVI